MEQAGANQSQEDMLRSLQSQLRHRRENLDARQTAASVMRETLARENTDNSLTTMADNLAASEAANDQAEEDLAQAVLNVAQLEVTLS